MDEPIKRSITIREANGGYVVTTSTGDYGFDAQNESVFSTLDEVSSFISTTFSAPAMTRTQLNQKMYGTANVAMQGNSATGITAASVVAAETEETPDEETPH